MSKRADALIGSTLTEGLGTGGGFAIASIEPKRIR